MLTKIIRYPAPSETFPTDQGVGAHTDAGFLTLLHQDTVGGFEAEVHGGLAFLPILTPREDTWDYDLNKRATVTYEHRAFDTDDREVPVRIMVMPR